MTDFDIIERHLKTHSERSAEDRAAVTTLESFLISDGKINTDFSCNDKWPNTDGIFEFVPNPLISRRPLQCFCVQIKGTHNYIQESDGSIKYSLKSLAFPAYIHQTVTADPGILFVVLNPDERGKKRVFWKYMSMEFISTIDFNKDSTQITFAPEEEIFDTKKSIDDFCRKLESLTEHHKFVNHLENQEYSIEDALRILEVSNAKIEDAINRYDIVNNTRDSISSRILDNLNLLCVSALLLNMKNNRFSKLSLGVAYEQALLNIKTKYLAKFYMMLKYRGYRIPENGQSERLMLKYYNFMWQIRKDAYNNWQISILNNLEKFPLSVVNTVDEEYYQLVANAMGKALITHNALKKTRYYIQKKTPFFVGKERFFEITLQLAGKYATKYNRITVYTKENISTNYSIQIGYQEETINLWDVESKIKIVTDLKVSIFPSCLNYIAKILYLNSRISATHGEYISLMDFLTKTGVSLLEFIDFRQGIFDKILDDIYKNCNTHVFKDVLISLQQKYNKQSTRFGKNTVRYILLRLKEETFEHVLPYNKTLCDDLYLSSGCYPFEKNPLIANLAGSKTSNITVLSDVEEAVGYDKADIVSPYLHIRKLIQDTGEIFFDKNAFCEGMNDRIDDYNDYLDSWERKSGFSIGEKSGYFYIDSYVKTTLDILQQLINHSQSGNNGQKALNNSFIKNLRQTYGKDLSKFGDEIKIRTLENIFVFSKLLIIYGAAGTGKTTLINYISNLMGNRKKLFLTKTHNALQNLMARIENPGGQSDFISLDSFTRKVELFDYDIIFVDECSTIDNRTMQIFLEKLNPNTLLVLAGDIYQIESIDFGNWFFYAKDVIKQEANVELLSTWRTKKPELIGLWNEVRNKGLLITEKLAYDGPFSEELNRKVFDKYDDDEVVLCLNYDGKFGLNNINKYFQNANQKSIAYSWQEWSYKVGDPILFNSSERFPILYNNLKGKIMAIEQDDVSITFTIEAEIILTEADCIKYNLIYLGESDKGTYIKFSVLEYDADTTSEDKKISREQSVVPFQLAYAVSIHKSQGLEYNSVKIIIPNSNSEKITHGIFYTAITRAKEKLKIFWSPETMTRIISGFENEERKTQSLEIVKSKLKF